jgi:hypothetical protein
VKKKKMKQVSCQLCGLDRDEVNPEYQCVNCGRFAFDCCVADNDAICTGCKEKQNQEGQ